MNRGGRVEPTPPECALAAEMFDHLCSAGTMKQILALHREICNTLNLKPNRLLDFYPKLKAKLASSWKAQALFKKFDMRANHKVYGKGWPCTQNKVLIIGAGPCGMRAAIECQLLGAKVVVIEKRDRISRNNVLHLWPFVIHDLRSLGAKKFFGKFCAGSIDHISIRQLQCILIKVSLLLGVEFHEGVSFEELLEPTETLGWRARVSPSEHPVSQYEFDVLIGADGKRNTLHGFKRKEFRGKLAMAITANFINRHTEQEASVPEISGVAFIFNQKFFKELYEVTGIDLENIVYYKDDTHYFVMTAKKHSLLDKGVLLNDFAEVSRLLSVENVDRAALMRYAQEAARFSTEGRLPLRDFALNHYGDPDVALFDFTSMYAAENASLVRERHGRRLLCQLVGDSLLEPFWPTGSGCARGFLSALDSAWAVRTWGSSPTPHPLEVIAERESIYRLLAQTTPENLHRDFGAYTLDPGTRYPNLNRTAVTPFRVTSFYDSDEPLPLDAAPTSKKRRREHEISEDELITWVGHTEPGLRAAVGPVALSNLLKKYRPDLLPMESSSKAIYYILQQKFGITPVAADGSIRDIPEAKIRSYLLRVYHAFKGEVPHIYHKTDMFDQIKQSQQSEKNSRHRTDHSVSVYSNAADTDKSHSNCRKKRRSIRTQVSNDPVEYIKQKIGKLDLNDITQLARLIEGHDAISNDEEHAFKQKELQEQIVTLLDPEDSPHPKMVRDSLEQILKGNTKVNVKAKGMKDQAKLAHFFRSDNTENTPIKQSLKLKGIDANAIKAPDFFDIFDDTTDTDATLIAVHDSCKKIQKAKSPLSSGVKQKQLARSFSSETPAPQSRRLSEVTDTKRNRCSQSPEILPYGRSNSVGPLEATLNMRRKMQILDDHKRHTPSPEPGAIHSRLSNNPEMAMRWQRKNDILETKQSTCLSTKRRDSIGTPELALRRQRVVDLMQGKSKQPQSPEPLTQRRNSGEIAFRMQRVSEMMKKKNTEAKRPKCGGKRKAAREIMKQRFEKSLQMLAAEPRLNFVSSTDLENDYGLLQYRANAPQFDERVKKLERKLQHYEEGRIVGGGGRNVGGGARVARLAAELSSATTSNAMPGASKPKDLMRSVGKIERDDWNVKEIERKIMENKLGRPEPKTAEKVPKWDRQQFLGRQRRLKEGDANEEKWGEIDETLQKLDQKLNDSGRPVLGTQKVANLATKFGTKEEPKSDADKSAMKEELKKPWRGPLSTGMQCAACGTRVFAAEGVTADGLHLHRACFRCAVCKAVLRPGSYTMERYGSRLVCLRHSGVTVPDAIVTTPLTPSTSRIEQTTSTPERISLELSDGGAKEIDEDEWTDRNFLASETSGAGGLSDEDDSSSDEFADARDSGKEAEYSRDRLDQAGSALRIRFMDIPNFSDDSFGYDDYSDDGAESSGNESCSRMRAAREARRREVPAEARPPTDSSEVESEEESESSDEDVSSATEVSTDSEFARDECTTACPISPPAILVTEAPPALPTTLPVPSEYPLSRTRSAGGLATKRALELKRKYLLGESSPPAVKKSDSTSQLDTKLEAFRSTITEFQKLLNPAPAQPQNSVTYQLTEESKIHPMPDIIKNLCSDAPVDLLTKGDSLLCKNDWREPINEEKKELDIESDSLSEDDSSHTKTMPNQSVPRVEVHDEVGELIQLDSLMIINDGAQNSNEKTLGTDAASCLPVVVADSESSESCRDATTLALTETELSDWAAESAVLDECGFDEKEHRKRCKNPRSLSGPKLIHETKNILAITSHVCGRSSPEPIVFSNALEHFEFADEGDQDPSIESPVTPRNEGYMELIDDPYFPTNDRSMNFIERNFSDTTIKPNDITNIEDKRPNDYSDYIKFIDDQDSKTESLSKNDSVKSSSNPETRKNDDLDKFIICSGRKDESRVSELNNVNNYTNKIDLKRESTSISDTSPPLENDNESKNIDNETSSEDISPPLASEKSKSHNSLMNKNNLSNPVSFTSPCSIRLYAPVICRSASISLSRPNMNAPASSSQNIDWNHSFHLSSDSMCTPSPPSKRETNKVQELKKEREEQTEVVRRLVLERLGSGGHRSNRKCSRRNRASPSPLGAVPPPVPPPPMLSDPPTPPTSPAAIATPPPRPVLPLMSLPVTSSFSDPDLTQERRRKGIIRSISNYLNRRLGPRQKCVSEPDLTTHVSKAYQIQYRELEAHTDSRRRDAYQTTLCMPLSEAPPVPPPPASYSPLNVVQDSNVLLQGISAGDEDERDAMQLWFEARWARLVAQRRAREHSPRDPGARRLARLQRRLTRPLSAEQQAAAVAELVQVSAQRDAHKALLAADRRQSKPASE